MYAVPEAYYYRLHHVRPRFKDNVEHVLVFMATKISGMKTQVKEEYDRQLNSMIKEFPGNSDKKEKTINNWRTEISSLFGLMYSEDGYSKSGLRAKELTDDQDLMKFFKIFLYNFEYPGAHLKDKEIVELCQKGIKFRPAPYILEILKNAERKGHRDIYLTAPEVVHCIFNDLRCTRDRCSTDQVWSRIRHNRDLQVSYNTQGDIIRYGKDILDYMVLAGLLVLDGSKYRLSPIERKSIDFFIRSPRSFEGYDQYIGNAQTTIDDIRDIRVSWFEYVNEKISGFDFSTNVGAYIPVNIDYQSDIIKRIEDLGDHVEYSEQISTAEVGKNGESIIVSHERNKLRKNGFSDLAHLVNFIPTKLGVGYDIQSIECDKSELRKYIEVKTTVSRSAINFDTFHITENEWRTARSVKDRFYIYRLQVFQNETKLMIINNLYKHVREERIKLIKRRNGYDVKIQRSIGVEESLV